jgi:hypothetical protein
MSLAEPDVIDVVVTLPNDPRLLLLAYDGGEIPDTTAREIALQKKLDAYLKFVVSGQYAKAFPEDTDRDLCIVVICSDSPTEGMRRVRGIRDHRHPETFLPVEVITHAEFRERYTK